MCNIIQAQPEVALDPIEEQRCYDEQCEFETKAKDSKELLSWLQKKGQRELGELTKQDALKLTRKLYSLGAVKIWATRIERDCDGSEYSKRLIIALPPSRDLQGKIFELCADPARPFMDGTAPAARVGGNYMAVNLM